MATGKPLMKLATEPYLGRRIAVFDRDGAEIDGGIFAGFQDPAKTGGGCKVLIKRADERTGASETVFGDKIYVGTSSDPDSNPIIDVTDEIIADIGRLVDGETLSTYDVVIDRLRSYGVYNHLNQHMQASLYAHLAQHVCEGLPETFERSDVNEGEG